MPGQRVQRVPWGGLLAMLVMPSCVPVALPPMRVDGSIGTYQVEPGRSSAGAPRSPRAALEAEAAQAPLPETVVLRASGGVHLASLMASRSFPIDVGVGYALNSFPGPDARLFHGAYGEISPLVAHGSWWRLLAGARGELILADRARSSDGLGFYGRVAMEAISPVSGSGVGGGSSGAAGGAFHGIVGAGLHAEVGAQRLPGGDQTFLVTLGLSFRTPAAFGLICCARR